MHFIRNNFVANRWRYRFSPLMRACWWLWLCVCVYSGGCEYVCWFIANIKIDFTSLALRLHLTSYCQTSSFAAISQYCVCVYVCVEMYMCVVECELNIDKTSQISDTHTHITHIAVRRTMLCGLNRLKTQTDYLKCATRTLSQYNSE